MWLFKKKADNPHRTPLDGPWSVSEGQHDGREMIVRLNTAYRQFGSVAGYEHQVGIAIPLNNPEATGLPSSAEMAQLDKAEDLICNSLKAQAESLLVGVITTSYMREFVFYTREPHRVQERFDQLRNQVTTHEMQLLIQSDAKWRIYAQLTSA